MNEVKRKARRTNIIADIMGCCRMTVIRMIESGEIEAYRIGKIYYVYLDSIEKYRSK